MKLLHRFLTFLSHARPWISQNSKGETFYGIQAEFDWTDPEPPTHSSEVKPTSAVTSTKEKQTNE